MNCHKDLIKAEEEVIEEIISNEYSHDGPFENEIITQDIIGQLLYLNNYNIKLFSLIKRDYSDFKNKDYFDKYYCINSKWMSNFLKLYNYKMINILIREFGINTEEKLFQKVKEKEISLYPSYYDE